MDVDGKKKSGRKFDMLSEIVDGKENIRIKVRVIRMWNVPTFLNPSETNTVELVFVDEKVSNNCCYLVMLLCIFIM
jgi:hypothetical protein